MCKYTKIYLDIGKSLIMCMNVFLSFDEYVNDLYTSMSIGLYKLFRKSCNKMGFELWYLCTKIYTHIKRVKNDRSLEFSTRNYMSGLLYTIAVMLVIG